MTITKQEYAVGDTVWIYGISRNSNKITQGKIIHSFTLEGWTGTKYVISVPTPIEPLLEIRTWETISQDSRGPIGALRNEITAENSDAMDKQLSQMGLTMEEEFDSDIIEPTPEQIHAAIEKSQQDATHGPLNLKTSKPKYRPRKRKV
jgi:hypothetical protein